MIVYLFAFPESEIIVNIVNEETDGNPVETISCFQPQLNATMIEAYQRYHYRKIIAVGPSNYTKELIYKLAEHLPDDDNLEIIIDINETFEQQNTNKLIGTDGRVLNAEVSNEDN